MTRIISFCSLLFLGYLFVSSCASPSSPTGGPKDTIPPNLISSVPVNQSLNYEKRTFTLEFDERIKTEKLKEQLIITPLTESDYDYVVKKNTFKITFEDLFLKTPHTLSTSVKVFRISLKATLPKTISLPLAQETTSTPCLFPAM
jgi:hypothetical protein